MTERERLINLLKSAKDKYFYTEDRADHLLANGVIVLPCKVGDTVYLTIENEVVEDVVLFIHYDGEFFFTSSISDGLLLGKSMFLTREEAEAKLKEGEGK